jgi:hypothetical protein
MYKNDTIIRVLIDNAIEKNEVGIVEKFFLRYITDTKLRDSLNKITTTTEGKMEKQLRKCVLNSYLDALITGKTAKITTCASQIAHQISFYSNSMNAVLAFSYALKIVKSLSSKLRMKKKRFLGSYLTKEFAKKYPEIDLIALEYLHYAGKLELVKDDFKILENFLNLSKKKDERNVI